MHEILLTDGKHYDKRMREYFVAKEKTNTNIEHVAPQFCNSLGRSPKISVRFRIVSQLNNMTIATLSQMKTGYEKCIFK